MRGLQEIGPLFSGIAERFITHRAYALATAEANLEGLLSPKVSACWLSSLVLLRRGEGFEARPLLDAAQLGPIRAIAPGDFKGDGRRDLFAAMGFPLLGEPCDAVAEDWNGDGVSDRVVSEAGGGLHWIQSRKADGRSAGEPPKTGERAREPQPVFRLRTPGRATGRAKP
jgi:hypothetical protein